MQLFEPTLEKKSMMSTMIKTYSEVLNFKTFKDRFRYLKLGGVVGEFTFNGHRQLNQVLYQCDEWKRIRDKVIIRDNGCDLAVPDRIIARILIVHHINPITIDDILERNPIVFDLENLICCSMNTHNAIHYSNESILPSDLVIRRKNDTCPWRS